MKNHNLVWIPFFGIYLTKFNPFIIRYDPWVQYQMVSIIIMGLWALSVVYQITKFLIFVL